MSVSGFAVPPEGEPVSDERSRVRGARRQVEAFEKAELGIEYMYAFAASRERGKYATLVFRLEDPDRAAKLLSMGGVKLVSSDELFARAGA